MNSSEEPMPYFRGLEAFSRRFVALHFARFSVTREVILTVAKVLGLRIVMDERYPGSKVTLKKESGSRSEKGYQASAQSQKAGAKSRNATSHCPL